ncbi:MAG: hypothetical protein E7621_00665 [Ruminococcaceae bacterium]|nr:hypothetical protein [Oscillospiraceae bacterium]
MKKSSGNTKKGTKLYNVLFPLWMLMLFPQLWLIVLPGNFIIDSLVLIISLFALKIAGKKQFYKKHILKIFAFGLFSDIIGSAYMLFMVLVFEIGRMGDELYLTLPGLLISATLIFVFNYFITFRKCDRKIRLWMPIVFAVFTAPYTFLIPSSWIYY